MSICNDDDEEVGFECGEGDGRADHASGVGVCIPGVGGSDDADDGVGNGVASGGVMVALSGV